MPPPGPDGEIDASSAPDFLAVAGRDGGIAGYTPRRFVLEPLDDEPAPVYADDLTTLVGHMVAGKGFVPLGLDPALIPNVPAVAGPSVPAGSAGPGTVSVYVRNASTTRVWLSVRRGGTFGSAQRYGQSGAGCLYLDAGDELVMLDDDPTAPGATVTRVLHEQRGTDDSASLWIDVAGDGTVGVGPGVPEWWSGGAVGC